MNIEEIAAKAAADVARYEGDTLFLVRAGTALAEESARRRAAGEPPLDKDSAAALIAAMQE